MAPQGSKRSVRATQRAATSGMGVHFTSPLKQRDKRKKVAVLGLAHAAKLAEALSRLQARLARQPVASDASPLVSGPSLDSNLHSQPENEPENEEWIDDFDPHPLHPNPPPSLPANTAARRRLSTFPLKPRTAGASRSKKAPKTRQVSVTITNSPPPDTEFSGTLYHPQTARPSGSFYAAPATRAGEPSRQFLVPKDPALPQVQIRARRDGEQQAEEPRPRPKAMFRNAPAVAGASLSSRDVAGPSAAPVAGPSRASPGRDVEPPPAPAPPALPVSLADLTPDEVVALLRSLPPESLIAGISKAMQPKP
ncbi:hypothetical protein B0H12DRAFT_1100359 [Mycena haematopus]|nr:hypothetical protein B0H12DRAFT_1100359 [Mycena haematopus]